MHYKYHFLFINAINLQAKVVKILDKRIKYVIILHILTAMT
ncbi:hypothetical protein DFR55_10360 [Herbinix hemicellulosilytica]|uniref:Uncharacterized protein n=1 Tax=Herbinix hemicellulosilytica TaxID=1564487 RepID=A0A0H5SG72_HERHM|nr:hypothetical protein DFR55_10360 [Herbinix hemicellulosilytica]CRZ33801.1 hypothetical protein HHT355_0596 [Herbinix hemicellulosilytica]